MNSRIINNADKSPEPDKPQTMKELLDGAHNDWKLKRKDRAFMKVLNALAMMSHGVALAMRDAEEAVATAKGTKPVEILTLGRDDLVSGLQSLSAEKITVHSFRDEFLDKIISSPMVQFKDGDEIKILKNRDGSLV